MRFKKDVDPIASSDVFYDVIIGGYFDPKKFLVDADDIGEVENAIDTIQDYIADLEENGIIEEM